MSVITVTLHDKKLSSLSDKELRQEIKRGFKTACQEGVQPDFKRASKGESRRTVSLYLSSLEQEMIAKYQDLYAHESKARIVAGLYWAAQVNGVKTQQTGGSQSDERSLHEIWYGDHIDSGMQARAEQKKVLGYACRAYSEKKIALIECSTGFGKSAIIGTQAYEISKDKRVVVSGPSYSIIKTLIDQYQRFVGFEGFQPFVLLCGKNEYVSKELLLDYITEHSDPLVATKLEEWIHEAAGRPNAYGKTWMYDDAKLIDPELPSEVLSIAHSSNTEDSAVIAYKEQFAQAGKRSVIFCTHSMLAYDLIYSKFNFKGSIESEDIEELLDAWKADNAHLHPLSRVFARNELKVNSSDGVKGLFEPYSDLIVDEAHELSGAISRSGSVHFSFWSIKHEVLALAKKYKLDDFGLSGLYQRVQGVCSTEGVLVNDGRRFSRVNKRPLKVISLFADSVKAVLEQAQKKRVPVSELSFLGNRLKVLEGMMGSSVRSGIYSELRLTSHRKYPTWVCGRRTIEPDMDLLWRRVDHASLYSATLYSYTNAGTSHYYTEKSLVLPKQRLLVFEPMIAKWQIDPIRLFVPERINESKVSDRLWLQPVTYKELGELKNKKEQEALKNKWISEVGVQLKTIIGQAVGGVVVLCSSYEDADRFSGCLDSISRPIIKSEPGVKAPKYVDAFVYHCEKGDYPVWIAVGSAWTGLEIVNKKVPASKDHWLSDVVIPKLPFGVEDTSSHLSMWRDNKQQSYYASGIQCFFKLKQGVGRLVRRPGSAEKNIWILDSRIYKSSWQALTAPTRGYLDRFRKKTVIQKP